VAMIQSVDLSLAPRQLSPRLRPLRSDERARDRVLELIARDAPGRRNYDPSRERCTVK